MGHVLTNLGLTVSMALALLAAPTTASAANVLLVSDSGQDLDIATALMADGHAVTVRSGRFSGGTNPDLSGDLSSFDVVYWSQDGTGSGDVVTDTALLANLASYVMAGGRLFVTGYDSVASPPDPLLVELLGATDSVDVVGVPGPVAMIDNSLTTGVVDIRGVTPTGGVGDTDHLTGLRAGTVEVCPSATGGGSQWTLRTLGAGEIAYVSNGLSSLSWTNTMPGGAGAYNAAIRNFARAGTSRCMGEGTACTDRSGVSGTCRSGNCCTGCWDGTCRARGTLTACGIGGGACTNCQDTNPCTLDSCLATSGTCFRVNAGTSTSCDDGLFCTTTDACDGAGRCVGSGARCDDANACTTDTCNEATDACSSAPIAEGAACLGGVAGVCRGGVCCRGCWDGAACQLGTSATACGASGSACRSCADGDLCTTDVCTAGACANPPAAAGTSCDDGRYCSAGDTCDATGTCRGGPRTPCDDGSTCTIDSCDEPTRSCSYMPVPRGCIIAGTCHGEGVVNPSNPCEVCDPARSEAAWSVNVGAACGTASCTAGTVSQPVCDAVGACGAGTPMTCPTGACADSTSCEALCVDDGDCSGSTYCDPSGECVPRLAPGAECERETQCAEGTCASDGHCCNGACTSRCLSCNVPGSEGTCTPVPEGTDPDDECPTGACTVDGLCSGADAGGTDGGVDGGGPTDGGADDAGGLDGGGTPMPITGGCCGVAGGRASTEALLIGLIVGLVLARRRRR